MTSVIGLDLSLTATGIADADGNLHTITTRPADRLEERLWQIVEGVWCHFAPGALVVIEDVAVGLRNAAAGWLGMVHGAVRLGLYEADFDMASVPPATLKKYATGRGNATKADMRVALLQRTGLDIRDDNQVDAFFLRAMGLHYLGEPILDLPKSHIAALDKVNW